MEAGYVAIGMDHFALPDDSLAIAYHEGKLMRNFQGYSVECAEDMLPLGVTSIGYIEGVYLQNVKTLEEYAHRIHRKELPILRGFALSDEDLLRKWVIQQIMCRFRVDKQLFYDQFEVPFDGYFIREKEAIAQLAEEGLLEDSEEALRATPKGRLFIRLIAALFDQYLQQGQFSKVV